MAYEPFEYYPKLEQTYIFGLTDNPDQYMIVDASIELRHEATSRVTQHPVEIGADITDFSIVNPRTFVLSGRISLIKPKKEGEGVDPSDILSGSTYRVSDAWNALEGAMREGRELSVFTNLKAYEGVLMTSLSTSQNWRTARVLDFVANMQEIIKVGVRTTELNEAAIVEGDARTQAQRTKDLGDIQTVDISSLSSLGVS